MIKTHMKTNVIRQYITNSHNTNRHITNRNMPNKRWILLICTLCAVILMTGCSGLRVQRSEQPIHPGPNIALVQAAVDGYYEKHQVLPIHNSEMSTPLYEKYRIDFARLREYGYLQTIPENAFENGGSFYYVLVNVEDDPQVKLLHIPSVRDAKEVERRIRDYVSRHGGTLPVEEEVVPNWYAIDYAKLGLQEVQVQSVFTNQYSGLIVHESGAVAIDYASDIMQLLMQQEIDDVSVDIDLRTLLVEHAYYVPAQSQPYYWVDGEPLISSHID